MTQKTPFKPFGKDTDIQFVKGVGPNIAQHFKRLNIKTLEDLIYTLPRRYEDKRNLLKISQLKPNTLGFTMGKLVHVANQKTKQGRFVVTTAAIEDDTGTLFLKWFNQPWEYKKLQGVKGNLIVYGMVKDNFPALEITNPEIEILDEEGDSSDFTRIMPVYALTDKLSQRIYRRVISNALSNLDFIEETLPEQFLRKWNLAPLDWALKQVHFPDSEEDRLRARRRLVFEEFFNLQLALGLLRSEKATEEGIVFNTSTSVIDELENLVDFTLTKAQKRVINEIFRDMQRPHPMNRLIQGDVGSGKTLVAVASIVTAVRGGYQAAMMAPTEILAEQHFATIEKLMSRLGVKVVLLVGRQTKKEKDKTLKLIEEGTAQLIIGTHALIQEGVSFKNLGFIVIDEQHRFGVMQRGALRQKSMRNPDVLVMTATPIPRSLTLTLYGDLDLSVIDELPPGRKPIKTHWKLHSERDLVYQGVKKLLLEGAQVYIVCPLVSESEKMMAQAAEELYKKMKNEVLKDFKIGLLHGQMKTQEKQEAMEKFRSGDTQVLVATPVIEVGVDVPNATVIVIEDANRFGLSQLHQLRGRVGRGDKQSYCVLVANANTDEAQARLSVMVETNDGFRIAEEDLKIRGPGELYGVKQSGAFELRVGDILQDGRILEEARQAAFELFDEDKTLDKHENKNLRKIAENFKMRLMKTDIS